MGIPIPKTLVIRTSPSDITLAIWVRVRVRVSATGDTHITRVFGMGIPKTRDAHITVTPLALVALAEKLATLSPGRFSIAPRRRRVQLGFFVLCAKTSL